MKIIHISDLHFGEHNTTLAADLLSRARKIKPDLILCTGDVVDNTKEKLFDEAEEYLAKLEDACSPRGDGAPRLIAVPGNHDYFVKGVVWRDRKTKFKRYFGDETADYYFKDHGVWVFGFDSASEGMTGGGGRILDQDLERFHRRYSELEDEPGFRQAYKIAAVHHHPLPVNWDSDWKQRWLTMTNAGAFLSAVLMRGVHLVLHGHEHLQARSRLESTLGGPSGSEITVLSLGATLRKVENPQVNWFGLVTIADPAVTAEFFPSVGAAFSAKPESVVVRSSAQRAAALFDESRGAMGYAFEQVVSYTIITADGDCRRVVEKENLKPADGGPRELEVRIPHTSGYLDKLCVKGSGMTVVDQLPLGSQLQEFNTRVDRSDSGSGSFSYAWYAVNACAMDSAQFPLYHEPGLAKASESAEFTCFPVIDPIEKLTVVVQFPQNFRPEGVPEIRAFVTGTGSPRTWKRASGIETELRTSQALRFHQEINVASLVVPHPRIGVSYGIQWQVPKAARRSGKPSKTDRQIQELRTRWLEGRRTEQNRLAVLQLLAKLLQAARVDLMDGWADLMEASFLYFSPTTRSLELLAAATFGDQITELDYGGFRLPYGMGIAGRAFKSNRVRIYAPVDAHESDEPDYYWGAVERPQAVLACFPVQNPDTPEYGPYGVFCLGSARADCPLSLLGESARRGSPRIEEDFLPALNSLILQEFVNIYLAPGKAMGSRA